MDTRAVYELALEVAKGDEVAADFIIKMAYVLHVWDDMIDKDKPVTDEMVNQAFRYALVDIPRNPFYMRNFGDLNPILVNAINNWHIANSMERSGTAIELQAAFIIRSSYADLMTHTACLIGGPEWAAKIGRKVRAQAHDEGFDGYLQNLQAEIAARENREGGA